MKKKEHLPYMGVGPFYGATIVLLTIIGVILSKKDILMSGNVEVLKLPFSIVGVILIVFGLYMWMAAIFQSKIDDGIKNNQLVTTGVYAYVRNPIYSAFMIACTGVLLITHNLWVLILPVFYWGFMTILMKNTEEKWLEDLYGEEYRVYCKKMNRCIPWKRRGQRLYRSNNGVETHVLADVGAWAFVYTMSQVDKRARTQLSIWRMYIIEPISEMLYEVYSRVGVSLLDLFQLVKMDV